MGKALARAAVTAAMVAATLAGVPNGGWAAPPPTGDGWHVADGVITWVAPGRVPMGDAVVEFWADGKPLGRPAPGRDQRTFTLPDRNPGTAKNGLEVRAAGRRLDAAPLRAQPRAAAGALPAAAPANPVDPGVKGPYGTVAGEYSLPAMKLPGLEQKVEMRGVVVAPAGAPGKRPLALFLHGRHQTCYTGDSEDQLTGDWPCPAGATEVPSYRGYLQAQELLASQGYDTVSISANGINAQDWQVDDNGTAARSALIRLHLAHWADWAGAERPGAPAIVRSAPPADLTRVLLMGHSRGGEGVNRAAMDTLTPPPGGEDGYSGRVRWTIRGTLLIGPTAYGQNPVPDVPSATILPGCDGDVTDLQGQVYVDGTREVSRGRALHSSLYLIGADHNFFNTEWTPGQSAAPSYDDFPYPGDPLCTPGVPARLTAAQQQQAGATYIAAAARLFVGGDDRVRPLLDGTGRRAPSAGPAIMLSHAVGAGRTPAVLPDAGVTVTGGGRRCLGISHDEATACTDPGQFFPSPHFVGFANPEPGRYAVAIDGTTPVTLRPPAPVSLAGSHDLALRLIVPPNTTGNTFAVTITDTTGARAALGTVGVDGVPASDSHPGYWAREVRASLTGAAVDLAHVATIELAPGAGTEPSWLLDAWGRRDGTPAPRETALPRIDVGDLDVAEGGPGTHTADIPVRVTGRGAGTVRLFLSPPEGGEIRSWDAEVRPGQRTVPAPVEWTGDDVFGSGSEWSLRAKAVHGLVVGDYNGNAAIHNDEPLPPITVTPAATATEGDTLTWQVSLAQPAEHGFFLSGVAEPPASGTELSTTDVARWWFTGNAGGADPLPSRPLSATQVEPSVYVGAGQTSVAFTTPTVPDDLAEGAEQVRWQILSYPDDLGDPVPVATVTGTVTD